MKNVIIVPVVIHKIHIAERCEHTTELARENLPCTSNSLSISDSHPIFLGGIS